MAIFGLVKKKSLLQQALTSSWRGPEERNEVLKQLKDSGLSPIEALPLLASADTAVRTLGSDTILARPDASTISGLLQMLATQPPHVRAYIARLLPKVPANIMEKVVQELLGDKTGQKQKLGWEVVLSLGPDLRDKYLERAVFEAPDAIRLLALQRLLQDRNPADLLDTLLRCARDAESRIATLALESLLRIQSFPDESLRAHEAEQRVFALMLDRFANADATSRAIADRFLRARALANPDELRKHLLANVSEADPATLRLSLEICLGSGKSPRDVLLEILLAHKEMAGWIRDRILDSLRTMGEKVLIHGLALLDHPDEAIRSMALVLVEDMNDPRVVLPVCGLLSSEDSWLRIMACDVLGRLKDDRALPYLLRALDSEDTRWAALDALARIGSPQALKPMVVMLKDSKPEVRKEIVRALGAFEEPKLLTILKTIRDMDPLPEVREVAASSLQSLAARLKVEVDNRPAPVQAISPQARAIDRLLSEIRDQGASDMHLTVGEPPIVRLRGELVRMQGSNPLNPAQTQESIESILDEKQSRELKERGEVDFCYAIPDIGRYRVNAFVQRRGLCAAFRVIPSTPPTFADLRLPGRLTELLDFHQGIIVVSGPAASGKTTTLAAIINLVNESKPDHVITLEDPIEFVHPIKNALVNQREVGRHTQSFARALRAALREDPDVIMVGEMRDLETIRMALMAAETGHLVLATLHTTRAVPTVDRLIAAFPPDEQPQVRMGLSESLKYVVCQNLLPRKIKEEEKDFAGASGPAGSGRVACFEVLKGTTSVWNLIRDGKTFQIPSLMQIGRSVGMQTLDQALMELVDADLITPETAWTRAEKPETFEHLCAEDFLSERKGLS